MTCQCANSGIEYSFSSALEYKYIFIFIFYDLEFVYIYYVVHEKLDYASANEVVAVTTDTLTVSLHCPVSDSATVYVV